MAKKYRVCIVGGGVQGLTALKNLLELNTPNDQLFDAEVLEVRDSIGGVWKYSDDTNTITALRTTLGNISKWRNCYSDFPVSEAWKAAGRDGTGPVFLNQEEMECYIEQYAHRFGLLEHVRFGRRVSGFCRARDGEHQRWEVGVEDVKTGNGEIELYDKIIVATGQYSVPNVPKIEGLENFMGETIHCSQFKSPKLFRNKKVLIVGSGNTAADISTELAGISEKVSLSHRRGALIFPRYLNHKPLEQLANRRLNAIKFGLSSLAPVFFAHKFEGVFEKVSNDACKGRLKPEWNLRPAPSPSFTRPIISDTILSLLESGSVALLLGIRKVHEDGSIEIEDGRCIDTDVIIFCTGYVRSDDCTRVVKFDGDLALPRLFHNIYHPDHADSLAYMTFWHAPTGICEAADLMAMGIAQVFSGRYQLPIIADMNKQIGRTHAFVNGLASRAAGPIASSAAEKLQDEGPWRVFLNDAAGTEVNEKLGYSFAGWNFWWQERDLCNLLMTGTDSLHVYRLFDGREGGRVKWDGARNAIAQANAELKELKKRLKEEEAAGKIKIA